MLRCVYSDLMPIGPLFLSQREASSMWKATNIWFVSPRCNEWEAILESVSENIIMDWINVQIMALWSSGSCLCIPIYFCQTSWMEKSVNFASSHGLDFAIIFKKWTKTELLPIHSRHIYFGTSGFSKGSQSVINVTLLFEKWINSVYLNRSHYGLTGLVSRLILGFIQNPD